MDGGREGGTEGLRDAMSEICIETQGEWLLIRRCRQLRDDP